MTPMLIPGLEEQLVADANRFAIQRNHGRRRHRRVALGGFAAALAFTSGAFAAGIWAPKLGNGGASITTSATAAPQAQRALLGVLRRPQTAADRGSTSTKALTLLRSEFEGVRIATVRALPSAKGHLALVSAVGQATSELDSQVVLKDPVCLLAEDVLGSDIGGGTTECYSMDQITSGEAIAEVQGLPIPGSEGAKTLREEHTATCNCIDGRSEHRGIVSVSHWYGLVPDGVTAVKVTLDGKTSTVKVVDNFFTATFERVDPTEMPRFHWE